MAATQPEPEDDDGEPLRSKTTLTSKAYRELLRRILTLELPPGATFSEAEIASQLELSKTPVREALVILMTQHRFVSVQRRSGYLVTPVTLREARDLFAVRQAIEPEAVAMAADHSLSATRLEQIRELALVAADPTRPVDEILRANTRFHSALYAAAHNHHLSRAVMGPLYHAQRLSRLIVELRGRPEEVAHSHAELIDAVAAGRPDLARQVTRAELDRNYKWAFDALMSADVLQSTNIAARVEDSAAID